MVAKVCGSVRNSLEKLLDLNKGKSNKDLLALILAFTCGFIWPLIGAALMVWNRVGGKHADIGIVAGVAAVLNVTVYLLPIVFDVAFHVL